MNSQHHGDTPSFELPPTQPAGREVQAASPERQGIQMNEKQSDIARERQVASPPQSPATGVASDDAANDDGSRVQQVQSPPGQAQGAAAASLATPQIADHGELIEKEWVMKAKEIVAKTANDPHLQNKEINRFKADYLRKRYNKEIKLSEDA